MQKLFPIFLFITLIQQSLGQVVFCPPGAEWHYSFQKVAFWTPPIRWVNEQIKYVRDSVIDNATVKVLDHKRFFKKDDQFSVGVQGTVIKQKGDTILFRNKTTDHKWQILYNYAALPGQSWQNTITVQPAYWTPSPTAPYTNTYTITVDSVKNVMVNSFNLKRLYVKFSAIIYKQGWTLALNTDTVYIDERMGCSQYLFNYFNKMMSNEDRTYFNGFLCYGDNDFGTKQFTEKSCNYSDALSVEENKNENFGIQIYPNPSDKCFTIRSENDLITGKSALTIKDLSGKEVKQVLINDLNTESYKVDVSDIEEGVYLLQIQADKSKTVSKLFMIER